jgi:hypothetical protein
MTEPHKHPEPSTQKTQPRGKDEHGKAYEPVEIPVPTRDAVLRDLAKAALKTSKGGG